MFVLSFNNYTMARKFVYIVEYRDQKDVNNFIQYRTEAYTSLKKANDNIANVIDCNNGYSISEGFNYKEIGIIRTVDYSTNANCDGIHVRKRLVI